jgi:pSer/pThr/pTyr-binding forkhead associated (FHA) protein
MTDLVTCPKCGTGNDTSSQFCSQCGLWIGDINPNQSTLIGTTTTVNIRAKVQEALEDLDRNRAAIELEPDEIAVLISNSADAIKIPYQRPVILGRHAYSTSAEVVFIDLNDYQGYALGVSRKHAQIEKLEDEYLLMDLGSSNGTFLNGDRLSPYKPYILNHGDKIMIGQLAVRFYTQTTAVAEISSG